VDQSLSPSLLIHAYAQGAFPMAERRGGPIAFYSPDPRAILPLDQLHVPRSLRRRLRQEVFHLSTDAAFETVIRSCAEPRPHEPDTWLDEPIIDVFIELHRLGFAHSVEAWIDRAAWNAGRLKRVTDLGPAAEHEGRLLVGGIYGLSLGAAFFAESMFSRVTDASKVCLVRLAEHLRTLGATLLDVQFPNAHIDRFGVETVTRSRYMKLLGEALERPMHWRPLDPRARDDAPGGISGPTRE